MAAVGRLPQLLRDRLGPVSELEPGIEPAVVLVVARQVVLEEGEVVGHRLLKGLLVIVGELA